MRGILKGISICMAGFSEAYYSHGNLISSVWTGGQYLIDPEMRARRIVNISQSASVEFCKAFWFLAESGEKFFSIITKKTHILLGYALVKIKTTY